MTYNAFDMVKEFHLKADQCIGDEHGTEHALDEPVILLRQRLMLEEIGELSMAMHNKDLENMADGLCDLLYVVAGTAVSMGVRVPDEWPEIKAGEARLPPLPHLTLARLGLSVSAVCSSITSTSIADVATPRHFLHRCFNEIRFASQDCQIDLETCFREVHRSNMSKNLGGATNGLKYGPANPKGPGYSPPDLRPVLGLPPAEPIDRISPYKLVEIAFGMPVFPLLAQDRFTGDLISSWIYRANQASVSTEKIRSAMIHRSKIDLWQREHPDKVKVPD